MLARAFWEAPDDALFGPETVAAVRRISPLTLSFERHRKVGIPYLKMPGAKAVLYRKRDVLDFLEKAERHEPQR